MHVGESAGYTKTVPVHKECNEKHSKEDEFFRNVVVSMQGVDRHPQALDLIYGKMTRSFQNSPHLLRATFKNSRIEPIFTKAGLFLGHAPAFEIDLDRFSRIVTKIVKGLFFLKTCLPLPPHYTVISRFGNPEGMPTIKEICDSLPNFEGFGDDVFLCRGSPNRDNQNYTFWQLVFYRSVSVVAITLPVKKAFVTTPTR